VSQHAYLERGLTVLEARLKPAGQPGQLPYPFEPRPFVTLSRETCAGATTVGQALVPMLDEALGEPGQPWVFLDKNLIAHALAQRNLPARLAEYLPEDKISEINGIIGELAGLHPPLWELEQEVLETILQLAQVGRVILVGRASFVITKSLPAGFHVRLVASEEVRTRRMMGLLNCSEAVARDQLRKADRGRRRYLQARFGDNPEDVHLYDLVINTDRISAETTARIIVDALRHRLRGLKSSPAPFEARADPPRAAGA
jgi:cytidylate kinase